MTVRPTTKFLSHACALGLLAALAIPAQAQTVDMSTVWPSVDFPKEGAFAASEAAKKLPGDQRLSTDAQRPTFFLKLPMSETQLLPKS